MWQLRLYEVPLRLWVEPSIPDPQDVLFPLHHAAAQPLALKLSWGLSYTAPKEPRKKLLSSPPTLEVEDTYTEGSFLPPMAF